MENSPIPPADAYRRNQQSQYKPKLDAVSDPPKGAQASSAVTQAATTSAQQVDKTDEQQKPPEPLTADQRIASLENAVFNEQTGLAALGENMSKILECQERFDQRHQ